MNDIKRNYKTLSDADRVLRCGDVYYITLHPLSIVDKFIISVFDENHRYLFDIPNATSFDFRMLRKVYTNVYYWTDEINALWPLSKRESS